MEQLNEDYKACTLATAHVSPGKFGNENYKAMMLCMAGTGHVLKKSEE